MNVKLIHPVLTQTPLENAEPLDGASRARKEQFARDFESVFIEKLFDEMKNTIVDWGLEQDAPSQQIQGLFWLHLARDVSAKGGLGMWKSIYQSLDPESSSPAAKKAAEK